MRFLFLLFFSFLPSLEFVCSTCWWISKKFRRQIDIKKICSLKVKQNVYTVWILFGGFSIAVLFQLYRISPRSPVRMERTSKSVGMPPKYAWITLTLFEVCNMNKFSNCFTWLVIQGPHTHTHTHAHKGNAIICLSEVTVVSQNHFFYFSLPNVYFRRYTLEQVCVRQIHGLSLLCVQVSENVNRSKTVKNNKRNTHNIQHLHLLL